jgi:hypothetical protein
VNTSELLVLDKVRVSISVAKVVTIESESEVGEANCGGVETMVHETVRRNLRWY